MSAQKERIPKANVSVGLYPAQHKISCLPNLLYHIIITGTVSSAINSLSSLANKLP
jgi:hypothetical protein